MTALRPVDPGSVDLVLAGIIREGTQGMCTAGKVCDDCDCFAGPTGFAAERAVAEDLLRQGMARIWGSA